LEDLEEGVIEYKLVGEFLMALKKEFGGGDEEAVKVAELKKLEQGEKTIKEFVQEFKKVARDSRYKGHPLIKEFKRGMNRVIRRKLMEAENQPGSIEQWCYKLKSLELDERTTLVLSNIRELDRDLSTNYSTLYTTNHGPCLLLYILP